MNNIKFAIAIFACLFSFITTPSITHAINLADYEHSVYSQNGEDGVIQKIFEIIKPEKKFAVEFGAGDGIANSNIRNLIVNKGWDAFFIEGDEKNARNLAENYKEYPNVQTLHAWVYPGNIEVLFEENNVPENLDFLVIDIDSNDYYVWKVIHNYRPKVVQIEFNASFAPPQRMVIEYHPMNYWDYSDYYGASIQSLYELGKKKGYELVYCNKEGVNLFFVDQKYFKRFKIKDNSPQKLYNPPQFGLEHGGRAPNGRGWPPYESFTINKDGQIFRPFDRDLSYNQVLIQKKFRHDY